MKRNSKVSAPVAKRTSSFSETEESEVELKTHAAESTKKEPASFQKVMVRTITASLLSLFYLGLLQTGHLYCILSIVLIQVRDASIFYLAEMNSY